MTLKFRQDPDPTGFPMLWVEEIKAYVHWIPVTKIQFEFFMCDAPDNRFDATWYDTILQMNARISPGAIRLTNYWRIFLSGITPGEAQAFSRWCGEGYHLPTLNEWNTIYKTLSQEQPAQNAIVSMGSLRPRISTLIDKLNQVSLQATAEYGYARTLADQMLMRLGVMEWVESDNLRYRWGGMGETYSSFHSSLFTPNNGQPQAPNSPEEQRLHYYGLRLIWRES